MICVTWFGVTIKNGVYRRRQNFKVLRLLRQEHGYGADRFLKAFSNKGWCRSSVLLKKINETDTVDRKPGSGKKRQFLIRRRVLK